MRLLRHLTLFAMLLCAANSAVAATPSEFYLSLLQRGIAAFDAERYADATNHLKLAAFGLVDSIENYQTAQVYLALSYDRLGDVAKAREAARRVVLAERIERKFATIALPAGVSSSFGAVATKLLGSADATYLRRPPQTATPPPVQQQAKPQPQPQPPTPQVQPPQVATITPPVTKPDAEPVTKPVQQNTVVADPPKKTAETPAEKTVEKPVEKPPVKPPQVATTTPPVTTKAPQPAPSKPIVPPSTTPPTPKPITAQESAARLAAGERALTSAQLADARRIYRSLLDAPGVARDTLIRAAEGLYRARDFEGALLAFSKLGGLRRGEEPYHYYMAVAYYETGQYARAKTELSAAVPFIEITPDVARYRGKIEGAID